MKVEKQWAESSIRHWGQGHPCDLGDLVGCGRKSFKSEICGEALLSVGSHWLGKDY